MIQLALNQSDLLNYRHMFITVFALNCSFVTKEINALSGVLQPRNPDVPLEGLNLLSSSLTPWSSLIMDLCGFIFT